jgi:putative glutamine amidotransferase
MNDAYKVAIPTPTSIDLRYNQRSWPMYADAVREVGGTPIEVNIGISECEILRLARECDGIILPGSPADVDPRWYGQDAIEACSRADRAREAVDRLLLEEADRVGKPLLGICYGLQSINVWRGGSLVQDLPCMPIDHSAGPSVAIAHTIAVESGSLLASLVSSGEHGVREGMLLQVNSSHHQAVHRVGEGLQISAVSTVDSVIEAIEGTGKGFLLGVQWHPERSVAFSETSRAIFGAFHRAVARGRAPAAAGLQ